MTETRQVTTRVSGSAADALDAAAYVRRQSMQQLLAPVLEAYAREVGKDSQVRAAIAAREAADGPKSRKVGAIDHKRSKV